MGTYRANRSFGAVNQNEEITFQDDQDPVLVSLLGAGYLDPLEGNPPIAGIPSEESVGTPTIRMEPPNE